MKRITWLLLSKFYTLIRPYFVKDIDKNEDFTCGWCEKPVLRRWLYCSPKCEEESEQIIE